MSSAISPLTAHDTTPSTTSTDAAINSTSGLANENTFLQLLVAQIKNQDPTQPIDSSTFLSQLASFSQLEQLIGIRQELQQDPAGSTTTPTGTTPTDATTGN